MPRDRPPEPAPGPPAWMATYSDTMTLLMTFFVLLMTFATSNPFKIELRRSMVVQGPGKTGMVGVPGTDKNAVIWSYVALMSRFGKQGSEKPPMYSDPLSKQTDYVLKTLEEEPVGRLSDSFVLRVPLDFFFDATGTLSPSGTQFLKSLAANLRHLPYDVTIQVNHAGRLAQATELAQFLVRNEAFHPSRLAVGIRDIDGNVPAVWFSYYRQP